MKTLSLLFNEMFPNHGRAKQVKSYLETLSKIYEH